MFRKRLVWIILIALLLVAGGGGYVYYRSAQAKTQTAAAAQPAAATATVQRGNLTLTASGSGTVVPATQLSLSFQTSGVLAQVPVKVGDKVQAGQLLAQIDDVTAQAQVSQTQISLQQAQIALDKLTQPPTAASVAAAQGSLASAKAALTLLTTPATAQDIQAARDTLKGAQDNLAQLQAGPDPNTIASAKADLTLAQITVQIAQAAYDKVSGRPGAGASSQAMTLWQDTTSLEKAQAAYNLAVKGATPDQIATAEAAVASAEAALNAKLAPPNPNDVAAAQANVEQAQAALDALQAGATADDLKAAQLNVAQAQLNLDAAQRTLAETKLVAPVSGTVIAVNAQVGEAVGTSAQITLADLQTPLIQFWVQETDLTSLAPGNAVNITFDALPDFVYPGKVISVDPALVTQSNTPAVQALASIDLSAHPFDLLSGMNGSVDIVAGQATNALLVPVQALREIAPGQFAVFVVQPDGQLQLTPVQVGIKDLVNAVITSGLSEGQVVSLGTTSSSSSNSRATPTPAAPRGPGFFFGGGG